jgi:hypothetical protein
LSDPKRSQAAIPLAEESLRTLQHVHRDLIGASVSITEQARDFLSQSGTIMILTDPTGVILEMFFDRKGRLVEVLDQCWDLLRQRRARRAVGLDPGDAQLRDEETVDFPS